MSNQINIIQKSTLRKADIQGRIADLEHMKPSPQKTRALQELHNGSIPKASFGESINISEKINFVDDGRSTVAADGKANKVIGEFIGTDNFGARFYERQRYEVDAGRSMEPILYMPIYNPTIDSTLPRNVPIESLGETGVVFEEVLEGGEVQFASVSGRSKTVEIKHYAVGIEYTEDLFIYNELFRLPNIERNFGEAHNALLNHLHLWPIINFDYSSTPANQTDGGALDTFAASAKLPEKYLRTLEAAATASATDETNPRRGSYVLLISSASRWTMERALSVVPQQGFQEGSTIGQSIDNIIVYDGWTGTRGLKQTTYGGVPSNKAYLIDIGHRNMDFQSWVKHPLRRQMDSGELVRFIMQRTVWDSRFGVFADPGRAVHEITLPAYDDGTA